jgi:dephospho-CoA kinase
MKLIIIAGKARVGKTTLANIIGPKIFDLGFVPKYMCFAGPLKEIAAQKGLHKESHPEEYRKFCQDMGAKAREKSEDFWVLEFESQLKDIIEQETKDKEEGKTYWERCVIVDDCRYANEIQLGLKYDATLIFLSAGTRMLEDHEGEWRKHHSESMAETIENGPSHFRSVFDFIIKNQTNVEDLAEKVDPMIPTWCGVSSKKESKLIQDEHMDDLSRCVSELIDLLLISDMIEDPREEEDEEEDEWTFPEGSD